MIIGLKCCVFCVCAGLYQEQGACVEERAARHQGSVSSYAGQPGSESGCLPPRYRRQRKPAGHQL